MSALPVKPAVRLSVSDWHGNNRQLAETAGQQRLVSVAIRQEGRALRSLTHSQTVWDQSDTSRRLAERLRDVSRWKQELEVCLRKVDEEMQALTLCQQHSEQALAATLLPLEVSTECVTLRDSRRGSELVDDPVDQQLHKETQLIGRVQKVLQEHVDQAFQQRCVLLELRQQLTEDLQNKTETLDIDSTCLTLSIQSANISLKTNPTRLPPGWSSLQQWIQFSQTNVQRAQQEVQKSQQLREETSLTRAQLQNELESQRRATEFDLRKRLHEEQQATDQLQWHVKKTEEEMLEMETEIRGLDADLQAKTSNLKLAHTRLETRTCRPGPDRCRDQVQDGLVAEVQQLEATVAALQQKLSEAQRSLQKMKLHHSHMLLDLGRKQEALSLEQRSINTRLRLQSPDQ